jgi:hypothetical protein
MAFYNFIGISPRFGTLHQEKSGSNFTSKFGTLHQEKSGSPGGKAVFQQLLRRVQFRSRTNFLGF